MSPKVSEKRPYEAPSITVVDESALLTQFQITSAATGWWTA